MLFLLSCETKGEKRKKTDMSLAAVRPFLYTRALARVLTTHESAEHPDHRRLRSFSRLMGELVSLFALVYIAEKTGSDEPWMPALGVLSAFFLPTVLLSDEAVRALRHWFGGPDLASHWLAGTIGVIMCYASYEALILFIERAEEYEDEK